MYKNNNVSPRQRQNFPWLCPFVWQQLPVWRVAEIKPSTTRKCNCGKPAEVNAVQTLALNDRAAGGGGSMENSDHFPWLFSEKLGSVHPLWWSPPFFLSFFRLYVQSSLFICQLFQRTKHCSALCNISQRSESSAEPRFGLELGLAVFAQSDKSIYYPLQGNLPVFSSFPLSLLAFLSILLGFWGQQAGLNYGSENLMKSPQPSSRSCTEVESVWQTLDRNSASARATRGYHCISCHGVPLSS